MSESDPDTESSDDAAKAAAAAAQGSAVAVLGSGSALTALSTTVFDGTVSTLMLIAGVAFVLIGAVLLGKVMKEQQDS